MDNTKPHQQSNIDDFDDEADIGPVEDRKKKIKEEFFTACKKGDVEMVAKKINSKLLDVLEVDENQWTALQWAVVNNHPEVVKIVYKKQKEAEDAIAKSEELKKNEENAKVRQLSDFDEAFKKPLNPAKNGKYTPIHWSAYKGYDLISSILLKMGCDPLKVDGYGNNALHQAAASNILDTFKLFMGLGIDLEYKNSRSHMALDLTTNKSIQDLIKKTLSVRKCQICEKLFDFFNKRFICSIHEDIICKNCCVIDYYYVCEDSTEKEITELLDSLKVVEDHKTIKKSVDSLTKMVQSAEENKVDLDPKIIERAFLQKNRLEAERDLRQVLDNVTVAQSSKENLDNLSEKVDNAKKCNVDASYVDVGVDLVEKITQNLAATELLRLFIEYPIREYPVVEVIDPKKKSKIFIF